MTTKLFKTRALVDAYVAENYPNAFTKRSMADSRDDIEAVDMPNLSWDGEVAALDIYDNDGHIIDRAAWYEDGTDNYELFIGGKCVATYNNMYDASEAKDEAEENEKWADEPREVILYMNGEQVGD